ncbi:MAG: hypothetical protein K2N73_11730 [Lachnospiraceae bacterium]|nr:hypothetical protein [Lachnospiraceae bacterium]
MDAVDFFRHHSSGGYRGALLWHCDGGCFPIIGENKAAMASGFVQASAGVGDTLMSPVLQHLTE